MNTIIIKDVEAVVAALPDWKSGPEGALSADVFIAAVGFEERTTVLLEQWLESDGYKNSCLLIRYTTNTSDNAFNLNRCRELLERHNVRYEELQYEQRSIGFKVSEHLGKVRVANGVFVDISSLASFVFYPLFHALFSVMENKKMWIGYVEALEYFPTADEWNSFSKELESKDLVERAYFFEDHYFQSKGTDRIYECLSFVGKNPDQLPGRLVLIPNFSFDRIFNMQEYAYRSYPIGRSDTEWIIGQPPNHLSNGWRADAVYALCGKPNKCTYCCTLDYKDIFSKLQSIWETNYTDKSICIASMASKAQHLGTFFFLLIHPEVSLILSEPTEFVAAKYSKGVGPNWFMDLDTISEFKQSLESWNSLEFRWNAQNAIAE